MSLGAAVRRPGLPARCAARVESVFSRIFSGADNPFHYLGALTVYFFWIALVTGIYLFVFYRTSVTGAWESVESITHDQWYAGGIMRSLHRYASDAAVITLVGHLVRELVRGRLHGPRWFSWFTGMPLIWIVIILGISGYWMVWDQLAQYVAISTAQLMDWLPIFTDPMSRNFLSPDAVSNRLFTLIAFVHLVGLPIILVLAIWFHLLRVRRPRINPPRKLMFGSLAALLALSLFAPVVSHPPADLDQVPVALEIDWYYLAIFPLQSATSEGLVWGLVTGGTLLLASLPWLIPGPRQAVARVHLPDCTGCGYCADDCPYGAIDMVPRTDGRNFELEARVDPSLCVSCGICTGSCPSSSPFRQRAPLTTGIEMPHFTIDRFRREIGRAEGSGGAELIVFGCEHGVQVGDLATPGIHTVNLPCVAMVPPAGIDFALRSAGYAGVLIAGCDSCDCHHRLGDRWMLERIDRQRQPGLRTRVPRERILTSWLKVGQERRLDRRIAGFREQLHADPASAEGATR